MKGGWNINRANINEKFIRSISFFFNYYVKISCNSFILQIKIHTDDFVKPHKVDSDISIIVISVNIKYKLS